MFILKRFLTVFAVSILIGSFLSIPAFASSLKIGGTGSALGGMQLLVDGFKKENPDLESTVFPSFGSGGGIKALVRGRIDIAVSARHLKDKEKLKMEASEQLYARSAIVPVVAKGSDLENLSSKDLIAIYSGERAKWQDGTTIRTVLRPENESVVKLLKSHITGMDEAWEKAKNRSGIPTAYSDQENAEMIESLPGAVGFSSLSLVLSEKRALKPLALDGTIASVKSVADKTYPLTKNFYIITRSDLSETGKEFIKFIKSEKGKAILESSGHYATDK